MDASTTLLDAMLYSRNRCIFCQEDCKGWDFHVLTVERPEKYFEHLKNCNGDGARDVIAPFLRGKSYIFPLTNMTQIVKQYNNPCY